ncbi:DUF3592 domain-containing protein [Ideonella sp. A 288]|uniref:DUF3592 domain-containing protein n=1 Tax=Ideonella sp. A 288 TaxID=1962181 RepID=UPI001303ECD2|nr:DUF3592 domain-containing protein [Ideonella sp. A 288]
MRAGGHYSFTESKDDKGRSFSPRVTYRYTVGRTAHQCDVIAQVITCPNTPQQLWERYGCRYPKGAQVVVPYDPARPPDAVLEVVANPWVMLIMPVAGAMLVALALWHLR